MITKSKFFVLSVLFSALCFNLSFSQEEENTSKKEQFEKLLFFDYRGTNAIEAAIGTSVINGDLEDPIFEIYFRIGYKHFLSDYVNIGFTYNKYNVAYRDIYNEGFMSFDLNFEYLMFPYKKFTPFIYAGAGYNAANYFVTSSTKVQGAIGFESIVSEKVGIRLFGEYNSNFSDDLDGLVAGATNDTFFRIGLGVNFYFGGAERRERRLKNIDTVINSNPIPRDN